MVRSADESPHRWVAPPAVDVSAPDAALRAALAEGLGRGGLSPMVSLVNHGLERLLSRCAAAAAEHHGVRALEASAAPPEQLACELTDEPLAPLAAQLRGGLLALSSRLLGLLSPAAPDEGVAAAPAAAAADSEAARAPHALEGRLCLRVYPRQPARVDGADAAPAASEGRLGPHCDSTLFTLLWSDAPGLQVLVL